MSLYVLGPSHLASISSWISFIVTLIIAIPKTCHLHLLHENLVILHWIAPFWNVLHSFLLIEKIIRPSRLSSHVSFLIK